MPRGIWMPGRASITASSPASSRSRRSAASCSAMIRASSTGRKRGWRRPFRSAPGHRRQRRRDPGGVGDRCVRRGAAGRRDRAAAGDDAGRAAVSGERAARRCGGRLDRVHPGADHRRPGRRRGERDLARLYFRSDARRDPRAAVERAAGDDHHRPDRRVRREFRAGPLCRRFDRTLLARLSGVALDVLAAGDSGGDLSGGADRHSGKPALPGRQGPRGRGEGRADASVRRRRGGAQGGRDPQFARRRSPQAETVRPDRQDDGQDPPDPVGGHRPRRVPAVRRHQRRLLLRRGAVGSGGLHRGQCAADQHPVRRAVDRGMPVHDRDGRPDRPQAAAAGRIGGHGGDAGDGGLGVLHRGHRCGGRGEPART